jgi:hypothetical protein
VLPAINLSQVSEFSLVLLELGLEKHHIAPGTKGMVSFAFVVLAALSTLAMMQSDPASRALTRLLKRLGFHDLDDAAAPSGEGESHAGARILILGFFRTTSSLVAELARRNAVLLDDVAVVDFNPHVHSTLKARGVKVIYGDISQRDTLLHAGIAQAEILVSTIPDALLKGTTNERLVRQFRELNPRAMIIATADVLTEIPALYAAGADYVSVARLDEAAELCSVLEAADCGLLRDKRTELDARLADREEVLP